MVLDNAFFSEGINTELQSDSINRQEISLDYFETVDKNDDGKIDLNEAILYAFRNNVEKQHAFNNATLWFNPMDTNKNGFIEPQEFDYSLA